MSGAAVLAIDIGGTKIRAGRYLGGSQAGLPGSLQGSLSCATPNHHLHVGEDAATIRERLLERVDALASELLAGEAPPAVCVGVPGPVDGRGRVLSCPTVWGDEPGAEPFPILERLRALWPTSRVQVINDVTAAGHHLVRPGCRDFCLVTISSGIGHKVFVDGQPVIGPGGRGGEIGHWRVDFDANAIPCDCGGRGHLGAIASGRGALAFARRKAQIDPAFERSQLARLERFDSEDLARAFRSGDVWATDVLRSIVRPLGQAFAAVHLAVGVERFLLMGGFARGLGTKFAELISEAAADSGWLLGFDWSLAIEIPDVDDDIGLLGAGRVAWEAL